MGRGRVDVAHLVRSGHRRAIRTYLPPGYEQTDRTYPVLYMFDGQNLFDRTATAVGMEWGIDGTIEGLVDAGHFPGVVVVGIDSPQGPFQRYAEYTAWDWMLGGEHVVADGVATADFVVEQVIPHVRANYRVAHDRDRVGLAGSSMGGYMTLFVGLCHPAVFSRLLAFSPIVLDAPMAGRELRDFLAHRGCDPATWVYLDMGDAEELSYIDHPARVVENLAETTAALAGAARPPERLVSRVIPGARHDEPAWGARFGEVLLWAFADGPEPE